MSFFSKILIELHCALYFGEMFALPFITVHRRRVAGSRFYSRYVGFLNRDGNWDATSNVQKQPDPSMASRYIWDVSPTPIYV